MTPNRSITGVAGSEQARPVARLDSAKLRRRSLTADAWHRLRRNRLALVGLAIIVLMVLSAVAAPLLTPFSPVRMSPRDAFQPPGSAHPFGTDEYGRDLLSRVLYGSRVSLEVGLISVGISLLVGTLLGLVSGYFLGPVDMIISRLMDVLFAFPAILLALVLIAILGQGIDRVMIAIGLVYTPLFTRVCRGSVLAERGKAYVEAARMIGTSNFGILRRHIFRNVLAPLTIQASLCMSYAILAEAALSFLGLGTQPPTPSWGIMLSKGRNLLNLSPWLSLWPGLAIMVTVFAFNVLGDGLRDALDPQLKGR
jgi:peptide/nickel transport system permease protein